MDVQSLGLLENYKDLGIGIIEFALDDYVGTIKSLRTYYKKLDRHFSGDFKARKYHERMGDVCYDIYQRIRNLNEIESFLTGEWVKQLTDMDVEALFRETKNRLKKKGFKVGLMGLIAQTDNYGVTVFAKEIEKEFDGQKKKYTMYSIGIATKDKNSGNWSNGYVSCKFKKDVVVANKTKIKINSSFFFASKSGGKSYTTLMITDFDVLEPGENANGEGFMKIPDNIDDEVPFL